MVFSKAIDIKPVGYKGDTGVLLYPSKRGYFKDKVGLQWNLLAARFSFVDVRDNEGDRLRVDTKDNKLDTWICV